ncbi:MAG TPA: hypothetical protein VI159_08095 [Gemmatimonadales bacterium]
MRACHLKPLVSKGTRGRTKTLVLRVLPLLVRTVSVPDVAVLGTTTRIASSLQPTLSVTAFTVPPPSAANATLDVTPSTSNPNPSMTVDWPAERMGWTAPST